MLAHKDSSGFESPYRIRSGLPAARQSVHELERLMIEPTVCLFLDLTVGSALTRRSGTPWPEGRAAAQPASTDGIKLSAPDANTGYATSTATVRPRMTVSLVDVLGMMYLSGLPEI
jgi:hypothetical protein